MEFNNDQREGNKIDYLDNMNFETKQNLFGFLQLLLELDTKQKNNKLNHNQNNNA